MRNYFRISLVIFAFWAAPASADTLTPVQFRDAFAARAAVAFKHSTVVVGEQTFTTKSLKGDDVTIVTENAYALYLKDPSKLENVLELFTTSLIQSQTPDVAKIEQLVIIVRPSDYITRSVGPDASLESFITPRPLAGDLSFFLAVDSPVNIRSASPSDLKLWKIDESMAWQLAESNLKSRIGPIAIAHLGDETGASGITADSGLAPSLMADPRFCSATSPNGISSQIILLYGRDMILFAVPSDLDMTAKFWKTAKSEITAGRSMSSTPVTCKNGHWTTVLGPN